MPCVVAPVPPETGPAADTEVAPPPKFETMIPCSCPATVATATVRLSPRLPFEANTPKLDSAVTDPEAATEMSPAPMFCAVIPSPPRTSAAETKTPVPAAPPKARMPCRLIRLPPATMPVAVTRVAPAPKFSAWIPCRTPVTEATLTVRFAPRARFRARTPLSVRPVTDPEAVIDSPPAPSFFTVIPVPPPVTVAAETKAPAAAALLNA